MDFYFEPSLEGFLAGAPTCDEGKGGSLYEYIMLRLRLTEGLNLQPLRKRYGVGFEIFGGGAVSRLLSGGYIRFDEESIRLTRAGFLVSNEVISELLLKSGIIDE